MIARSWAGGEKGREVMDRVFPLIPQLLSAEGVFYLVVIQENKPGRNHRRMIFTNWIGETG